MTILQKLLDFLPTYFNTDPQKAPMFKLVYKSGTEPFKYSIEDDLFYASPSGGMSKDFEIDLSGKTVQDLIDDLNATSTWSIKSDLLVGLYARGGAGNPNAALCYGGTTNSSTVYATTEEYDGASWVLGANMLVARFGFGSAGTSTAALAAGGYNAGNLSGTEEYNGASWETSGDLSVGRYMQAGCGEITAALSIGGVFGTSSDVVEQYNGNNWVTCASLNVVRRTLAACGTQNAALAISGTATAAKNTCEEFDGAVWVLGGNLVSGRYGLAAAGTSNAALNFGGDSPYKSKTEEYDGNAWSAGPDLIAPSYIGIGTGVQASALCMAGIGDSVVSHATQEYRATPYPDYTATNIIGDTSLGTECLLETTDSADGTIYSFSSPLWAVLKSAASELHEAKAQGNEILRQLSVPGANNILMDYWAEFFGVSRRPGEADNTFGQRIVDIIRRPKSNNFAMSAILQAYYGYYIQVDDSGISPDFLFLMNNEPTPINNSAYPIYLGTAFGAGIGIVCIIFPTGTVSRWTQADFDELETIVTNIRASGVQPKVFWPDLPVFDVGDIPYVIDGPFYCKDLFNM